MHFLYVIVTAILTIRSVLVEPSKLVKLLGILLFDFFFVLFHQRSGGDHGEQISSSSFDKSINHQFSRYENYAIQSNSSSVQRISQVIYGY
jgi:hypothetical protein